MAIIRRTVLFCTAVLCAALPAPAQPIAHDDTATLSQDGPPITLDAAANDTFTAPFPFLSFTPIDPAQGTLAYNNGGTFTFTPAPGFYGDLTFQYTLKGDEAIVEESVLHDPTGATYTAFGKSVAVEADTAVVGAPTDSTLGPAVGAVYVYTRTPTGWTLAQRIENPAPTGTTFFGECVGITGNNILVANNHGTEYELFKRTNGTWQYAGAALVASGNIGPGGTHFCLKKSVAMIPTREGLRGLTLPNNNAPINDWLNSPYGTPDDFIGSAATDGHLTAFTMYAAWQSLRIAWWGNALEPGDLGTVLTTTQPSGDVAGSAIEATDYIATWQDGDITAYELADAGAGAWQSTPLDPMPLNAAQGNSPAQVAIDNGYALIGAFAETTRPLYAGLYRRTPTGWQLRREIGQPAGAYQYASTALSQNHALIGMAYDSQPTPGTGTVRPVELYPTSTATVTIHVTPTFLAVDDHADALQDGPPVTIDVATNDIFTPPFPFLNFPPVDPKQGAVAYNKDGTLTFTPAQGFAGKVRFQYTLKSSDNVIEESILYDPTGGTYTGFGQSIALEGKTAVIGAPADSSSAASTGAVYVYTRANNRWTLAQRIENPTPTTSTGFGECVGVSNNNILVSSGDGTKYDLFTRTADVWEHNRTLTISSGGVGPAGRHFEFVGGVSIFALREYIQIADLTGTRVRFWNFSEGDGGYPTGTSIAVGNDGVRLIAAANRPDLSGRNFSHLTVFARDRNGNWTYAQDLTLGNRGDGAHGVDLDGKYAIAAWANNRAEAFTYRQTSFLSDGFLAPMPFTTASGNTLAQVAVSGNYALIGSFAAATRPLYAGVFRLEVDGWRLLREIGQPLGGEQYANVAISENHALVGIAYDSKPVPGTGAVRPLNLPPTVNATVTVEVHPKPPIITSTYPIRGTAYPGGSIRLFRSGDPTPIYGYSADLVWGTFSSDFNTFPYIGETLTAIVITPDGVASAPSAPVVITNPCPLPTTPANPSPADAATFVEPNVSLRWNGAVTSLAKATASYLPLRKRGKEGDLTPDSTQTNSTSLAVPMANAFQIPLGPPFTKGEGGEVLAGLQATVQPAVQTGWEESADLLGFGLDPVSVTPNALPAPNCPVTYDLYLGTSPLALTKAAGDLAAPSFTPALTVNTTYYWQVVSKGATGEVRGPIWLFTTRPHTVVRGDSYVLPENAPATVLPVLANDSSDLGPLSIASFTLPSVGLLTKNADNTFSYQPPANFHGNTSFTYTIADSSPGSIVTGVVSIVVTSGNRAPVVAHPVPDLSFASTPAQQGLNATLVFSDPDGDTLTYTVAANTNPALLTVARVGAGFTLTFAPGVNGEGDVTLRATDPGGLYVEDTFHVRVGAIPTPPVVTQQPISLSIRAGQNALFTCAATSSLTLTYRWQKDGNDLNNGAKYLGADTPQLAVLNVANADEGNYRCKISNGTQTVYTNAATLTVQDPYIVTEPADTTGGVTGTASFTVAAEGSGTLAYQWFRGNTPLADGPKYSGATTARLTIKDLIDLPQNTDEGYYHVEVKGFDPAPLRSRDALLLVGDPVITVQPQPQTVREGANAQFSVVAVGTPPLVYRWRRNGNFLNDSARYAGTQSPTLTLTGAFASDAGDFSCVVVGQEIATSTSAALTITRLPQILGVHITPASGIVARGAAFDLELILDGPVDNANFAWQHEGNPLADDARIHGSATATLHIDAAADPDAGRYVCTLTDGVDTVASPAAQIRIGLAFVTDLADAAGEDGKPFAWHTEVAGADGPLTWSWFRITQAKAFEPVVNTGRISGADTGTLHFDPLTYDDAGGYLVYALDTTDVAISRTATLTVAAELPAATALGLAALAAATALAAARRTRAKGAAPCAR